MLKEKIAAAGVPRIIIMAASLMGLVWADLSFPPNAGSLLGTLIFGGIFCIAVFWQRFVRLLKRIWSGMIGRIAFCLLGAVITAAAALCVFFSVQMAVYSDSSCGKTDCVIVLGCQVLGENPSSMLKDRLDAALELLDANPEALCIVSGGQGSRENLTEAEVMRRYLEEQGISDERIIEEPHSTSTEENLRFSAEILAELGISENITVVTNEFHQYRADIYARRAGLTVGHYSARTSLRLLPNNWLREWAALTAVIF